jgi:hypothetical protein
LIKVLHRINQLAQISTIDPLLGVEVDVHALGSRLVVHHDAFQDGPDLIDWLSLCGDRFVIFNIKEEGVETRVRDLAVSAGLTNFFMLDLSFPALIKLAREGETRIAIRVSEYESVKSALINPFNINWIWLDCFEGFPISKKDFALLKAHNFKICLVSPELHGEGRNFSDIIEMQKVMSSKKLIVDAVCTKFPELW